MEVHGIPREYKGEGRILYIFSTKALIYTAIGVTLGIVFFIFFKMIGLSIVGLIITAFFGLIGFSIATFKIPESQAFALTRKNGGEKIDDIIIRWIKFKKKGKKIYVYKNDITNKEENTNE